MWTAPDDKYWSGLSSQLLENLNTPDDIKCFWRISYVPQVMMSKVRTWEILKEKRFCDSVTGRRGRGRGSVICVHCRGWCPAQGDEGGGSRATIVIKADRGEEDEEAFHRHSQSSSRSAEAGGSSWRRSWGWCWPGGGAASDREMSQCYELLIATHPIHILMPNPSAPIGPSSPQHGEGKDENPSQASLPPFSPKY